MKTPEIKTDRLLLREVRKTDVKPVFDCWMQDEKVSEYMLWNASDDIDDAKNFIDYELSKIEDDRWFRWIIEKNETGEIIGTCLIFQSSDEGSWDVSKAREKDWGKGFMTEAMKAVISFAEEKLSMTECVTSYAKANKDSANVLHKLGFRMKRAFRMSAAESLLLRA